MASQPAPWPDRVRPIRRVEYERMAEMGVFGGEKLELLRGFIVQMRPQGTRHAGTIQNLTLRLVMALGASGRASVRVQLPFAAGDDSEPEPDLAVVPPGAYRDHHPTQALLVVEVAESSLAEDRAKAAIYAQSGVPEYWIVDTVHGLIEVHTDIVAGAYSRVTPYRRGGVISLVSFPDVTVDVTELLG